MIRNLARCPYCGGCEIALNDHPDLVFNPDGPPGVCPHLAWVDLRFADFELNAHGVSHMIGSTELRWEPPQEGAAERTEQLLPYLRELLGNGSGWAFAPAEKFTLKPLSAEEKVTDAKGHVHPQWEVDGSAIFAANPTAFWAALPACRERQLAALDLGNNSAS